MCNVLSVFQAYINKNLYEFLNVFISVYIDDAVVFSDNDKTLGTLPRLLAERLARHPVYVQYVQQVLSCFRASKLLLDIRKYKFFVYEVKYLGIIIKAGVGLCIDPEKVRAIVE